MGAKRLAHLSRERLLLSIGNFARYARDGSTAVDDPNALWDPDQDCPLEAFRCKGTGGPRTSAL